MACYIWYSSMMVTPLVGGLLTYCTVVWWYTRLWWVECYIWYSSMIVGTHTGAVLANRHENIAKMRTTKWLPLIRTMQKIRMKV